jgi:hypothetical protein
MGEVLVIEHVREALVEFDMSVALARQAIARIGLNIGETGISYIICSVSDHCACVNSLVPLKQHVLITGPASPLAPAFLDFFLSWPAIVKYSCAQQRNQLFDWQNAAS